MKTDIVLTWSKIVATLILIGAVVLDLLNGGVTAFCFALPFIVVLVTGKQYIDSTKKP